MATTTVALAALPNDAVADILHSLPMQSLAVTRCVYKAWRDIVDDRALLHPYLCSRSVRGVFINYIDHYRSHHFARPTSSSTVPLVDGMLNFLRSNSWREWRDLWMVLDHCNGLLLCDIEWGSKLCVCNPARRRWTVFPQAQMTSNITAMLALTSHLIRLCRHTMRLSLSNGKYQIIEAHPNMKHAKSYLGKLQNNVCFGIVHEDQLKIWILNEACGKMEWVLKCEVEVGMYAQYIGSMPYSNNGRQPDGSWIVQEDNTDMQYTYDDVETLSEKSYEWDSDNDDAFNIDIESPEYYYSSHGLSIIGFHPFKKIVFMVEWFGVVAYH
ncbi:hypothetical protein U9M48_034855 [Paspalum notatum var. saurae]|uniref:F-box domain-containing protein n=1 Tax=Paspalum notatum var. saurae TaxID=547442 RepID=A0AAQ3UAJ0_PASNO